MDRVISLLAALVGLIALAGAVLVATNGDVARRQMATDIAQLKTGMALATQHTASDASASAPASAAPADATLKRLEDRIAALEATVATQASALAAASAAPPAAPAASGDATTTALLSPSALPSQSANPAALSADGPTADCIPLGTRFMAKAGDSFPICKTKVIIKVAGVNDGSVTVAGAGDIAAGALVPLPTPGCQAMAMSADIASGYAELRVTCQ